MNALIAIDRRAGAGLTLQVEDLGAVREGIDQGLGLGFATLDVVGAHMGENAFDAIHTTVDGDDRHASGHGLLDCGRKGVDVERRDDDGVDLLHDGRLDVGSLLGRRVLAVGFDDVDALGFGLNLDLVEHVHEEREAKARNRAEDGQLVLGEAGRCGRGQSTERDGGQQETASIHGSFSSLCPASFCCCDA